MEYYSAIKKDELESVLVRWMNPEPIIQSDISQKEKNKYRCMWTLGKWQINLFAGQEWRQRHRESTYGHGGGMSMR